MQQAERRIGLMIVVVMVVCLWGVSGAGVGYAGEWLSFSDDTGESDYDKEMREIGERYQNRLREIDRYYDDQSRSSRSEADRQWQSHIDETNRYNDYANNRYQMEQEHYRQNQDLYQQYGGNSAELQGLRSHQQDELNSLDSQYNSGGDGY